jgi:single-strand DNA-binding protein
MEHKNHVELVGEVAKQPVIRQTKTGKSVGELRVRTVLGKSQQYHNCVLWEERADRLDTLHEGDTVRVTGRLQTRSYDAKDGTKKWVTDVVADEYELCAVPSQQPAPPKTEAAPDAFDEIPF